MTIRSDGNVKTRQIPGLTRRSVSTHGACRNINGDVFLCGNSGYIRKVKSDGTVAWDTNFKSDKGEDGTLDVGFSEKQNELIAFGFSFEPDTKFTTKESNLWLAKLDSDGKFTARTEFEGIVNLGKNPAFCLSKSGNPVVIYDNSQTAWQIYVTKFSNNLTKAWTIPIFDANSMMIDVSVTPLDDEFTLAILSTMARQGQLRFYIIDSNGSIINQAVFDMGTVNYLVAVSKDKIFFVKDEHEMKNNKIHFYAKLICFKINNCTEGKPPQN